MEHLLQIKIMIYIPA